MPIRIKVLDSGPVGRMRRTGNSTPRSSTGHCLLSGTIEDEGGQVEASDGEVNRKLQRQRQKNVSQDDSKDKMTTTPDLNSGSRDQIRALDSSVCVRGS